MGTRCVIALEKADASVDAVYCAMDGYPEGVGATLHRHYQSRNNVAKLMELRALNSLGATPEEPINYWDTGTPTGDPDRTFKMLQEHCVIHPNRPDLWEELQCSSTVQLEQMLRNSQFRHAYLWSGDHWMYLSRPTWAPRPLADVLDPNPEPDGS